MDLQWSSSANPRTDIIKPAQPSSGGENPQNMGRKIQITTVELKCAYEAPWRVGSKLKLFHVFIITR
jgi:hypothetical protein